MCHHIGRHLKNAQLRQWTSDVRLISVTTFDDLKKSTDNCQHHNNCRFTIMSRAYDEGGNLKCYANRVVSDNDAADRSRSRTVTNADNNIGTTAQRSQRRCYDKPEQLHQQSYDDIRRICLETGRLFEDPTFPANATSIGTNSKHCEWKRPGVSYD